MLRQGWLNTRILHRDLKSQVRTCLSSSWLKTNWLRSGRAKKVFVYWQGFGWLAISRRAADSDWGWDQVARSTAKVLPQNRLPSWSHCFSTRSHLPSPGFWTFDTVSRTLAHNPMSSQARGAQSHSPEMQTQCQRSAMPTKMTRDRPREVCLPQALGQGGWAGPSIRFWFPQKKEENQAQKRYWVGQKVRLVFSIK